ncbi:MAG: hypothetical protein CME06_03535 [Gemmatimonadetes bacterium]|nr:hypothetical protein [Gemmatimonadota bacterium]
MLRICLVVHEFFPNHIAGTEQFTAHLARALEDRGHRVIVFTREDAPPGARPQLVSERAGEMHVHRLYWRQSGGRARALLQDLRGGPPAIAFRRVLRDFRPHVVHFQHLLGLSLQLIADAKDAGAKCALTLNDFWFICPRIKLMRPPRKDEWTGLRCDGPYGGRACPPCSRGLGRRARFLLAGYHKHRFGRFRAAAALADWVHSPSQHLAQLFSRAWGEDGPPIEVSDYGIDVDGVREQCKDGAPRRDDRVRIAYIGAIIPEKGPDIFLDALSILGRGNWKARIHGDPEVQPHYGREVAAQARSLGVEMAGPYPPGQAGKVLADADLVVVPSRWWENRPLTVLEAFAAGVPVVAARLGGLAEMVRNDWGGWTFSPENAGDLARVLGEVIGDPDRRRKAADRIPPLKDLLYLGEEMETRYLSMLRHGLRRERDIGWSIGSDHVLGPQHRASGRAEPQ